MTASVGKMDKIISNKKLPRPRLNINMNLVNAMYKQHQKRLILDIQCRCYFDHSNLTQNSEDDNDDEL